MGSAFCSGKIKVEYEGSKGDDHVLGEGDGDKKSGGQNVTALVGPGLGLPVKDMTAIVDLHPAFRC